MHWLPPVLYPWCFLPRVCIWGPDSASLPPLPHLSDPSVLHAPSRPPPLPLLPLSLLPSVSSLVVPISSVGHLYSSGPWPSSPCCSASPSRWREQPVPTALLPRCPLSMPGIPLGPLTPSLSGREGHLETSPPTPISQLRRQAERRELVCLTSLGRVDDRVEPEPGPASYSTALETLPAA